MLKIKRVSYLFVLLFFIIVLPAKASSNNLKELSGEEKQKALEKLKSFQKDIHSLVASVSQEKQLVILKKKVNVDAKVTMAKPNMLRWDVTKPDRSITVIDGETMTVYHSDIKEAQVYNLSENLIARNTMSFFATAIGGNLDEMEKKFTVSIFSKDGEIIFKLVPLSGMTKRYLSDIIIYYDEETGFPRGFEVTTPKGERTITKLTNIKINPELKSDTFRIALPDDVWITNRPEQINN
ncbi:MAG: outer membrane lipoprotein carrier protein LolA [Nitrospirae bacterium]|nr:outer membrane lipoprotein carrier protein LolA [Nitrospirota bacterium]